ncbi:ABC transporter permease [Iamia sp. SCSIO 61187]|nr:ABC transporter permease [Iamia sp. SCSIO 61187]
MSLWSTVLVLLIAVPLGVVLTRPVFRRDAPEAGRRPLPWPLRPLLGRVSPGVLTVANVGQALPAYGLFIIFYAWQGTGFRTAVTALVVFALLPVLRNTMVGIEQVDPAIIEAGRGMGMSRLRVLLRIELPLSVPIILAGVRTALVINVGMAALAFLVGGGGLGITINSGLKLRRDLITVAGAGMVAILALTIDWVAAVVERVLRPRGL